MSSLEGGVTPGRHWITSSGRSVHLGCGMPMTAASATLGCPLAAFSTYAAPEKGLCDFKEA